MVWARGPPQARGRGEEGAAGAASRRRAGTTAVQQAGLFFFFSIKILTLEMSNNAKGQISWLIERDVRALQYVYQRSIPSSLCSSPSMLRQCLHCYPSALATNYGRAWLVCWLALPSQANLASRLW